MGASAAGPHGEARRLNRGRFRVWMASVGLVELALLLVFLLPDAYKEILILHRGRTNVIDLWGSHYVHLDAVHLAGNMALFAVVAVFLAVALGWQGRIGRYQWLAAANLLIVPLALSLAWVPINASLFPGIERSMGFSGVNAAFVGSFLVALASHVSERLGGDFRIAFLAVFALASLPAPVIYAVYPTAVTVGGIAAAAWVYMAAKLPETARSRRGIVGIGSLAATSALLPLVLFPASIMSGINVLIHYFGLAAGMLGAFLLTRKAEGNTGRDWQG